MTGAAASTSRGGPPLLPVLTAALLLGGCAARSPAIDRASPARAASYDRPPLEPFRVSLAGQARTPRGRARFAAGLAAHPPADFRLDIFHPVSGTTLLSLGVAQGQVRALWPESGTCLEGEGSPALFDDLLGLEVAPADILPLLTGRLYRDETVNLADEYRLAESQGVARLEVTGLDRESGARYTGEIWAARQGGARAGRRVGRSGEALQVEYPRWMAAGGGAGGLARRVELRAPQRRLGLDLEVKEWAAGAPAGDALLPHLPASCRRIEPAQARDFLWGGP